MDRNHLIRDRLNVMHNSRAHAIQERKNRRAAVKKTAMSSRISLLSGITASSSGSSGSGSTITQESITRPRVRNPKGDIKSKGKRQSTVAKSTSTEGKNSPRKNKGPIDVFAFLDKDQSRTSLVQKRSKDGRSSHQLETPNTVHDASASATGLFSAIHFRYVSMSSVVAGEVEEDTRWKEEMA